MILTNNKENIGRPDEYQQVCVWPGMSVSKEDRHEFQEHFLAQGFRLILMETIITGPDRDENGNVDPETGGRIDTIFSVHNDDVMKFAITRIDMGIKWIEDVLDNEKEGCSIYPDRVKEYRVC